MLMEIIEPVLSLLPAMGPTHIVILVPILFLGYYAIKVYPQKQRRAEEAAYRERAWELEKRRDKDQQDTNKYLRESSGRQEKLLTQNNETIKDLKDIVKIMSNTFIQVSERMAIHAKASEQMNDMLKEMYHDRASQNDVEKIRTELRDISRDMLNKQDAIKIIEKLDTCLVEIRRARA